MPQRGSKRPVHAGRVRLALVAAVAFTVVSCATDLPVSVDRAEAALPPDASMYLATRTEHLQSFIKDVVEAFALDGGEVEDIVGNSDRIVAAVGSTDDRGAITAAAAGSYPGGRIRFGLTLSRRWRREMVATEVSSRPYFRDRRGNAELAVPSNRLVFFANGGMADTIRRAALETSPDEAVRLADDAELSVLVPRIDDNLRAALPQQARGLPLESIEVNVRYSAGNPYATNRAATVSRVLPFEVYGQISLSNERAARVFSVIARLVIGSLAEGVPLGALSVEREEEVIIFSGLPANEERLREWLAGFLGTLGVPAEHTAAENT